MKEELIIDKVCAECRDKAVQYSIHSQPWLDNLLGFIDLLAAGTWHRVILVMSHTLNHAHSFHLTAIHTSLYFFVSIPLYLLLCMFLFWVIASEQGHNTPNFKYTGLVRARSKLQSKP